MSTLWQATVYGWDGLTDSIGLTTGAQAAKAAEIAAHDFAVTDDPEAVAALNEKAQAVETTGQLEDISGTMAEQASEGLNEAKKALPSLPDAMVFVVVIGVLIVSTLGLFYFGPALGAVAKKAVKP